MKRASEMQFSAQVAARTAAFSGCADFASQADCGAACASFHHLIRAGAMIMVPVFLVLLADLRAILSIGILGLILVGVILPLISLLLDPLFPPKVR